VTDINRRHLGGIILAAGASAALGGCAGATPASVAATVSGDVAKGASAVAAAASAAESTASAVAGATTAVATTISTSPVAAVSSWQQMLGLAEQVVGAVVDTNPAVATITAAISAGTTLVENLPTVVNDVEQAGSAVGSLVAQTSALQALIMPLAKFTASV
jgi:hypothetical protein